MRIKWFEPPNNNRLHVPLKAVLEMREDLLHDYENARLKFSHAKKQLEMINSILKDNRIGNYIHFNGDYDNWIKNFNSEQSVKESDTSKAT